MEGDTTIQAVLTPPHATCQQTREMCPAAEKDLGDSVGPKEAASTSEGSE